MIKELFKDDAIMFYVTIAFIAIFIVMLFATLFISIKTKAENDKLKREIKKFLHMIKYEYALIYDNNNVSTKHIEYICKKMKNYRFFQVMDGALQQLIGKNKTIADGYIYAISESFAQAIKQYKDRSIVHRSYFAYILSEYPVNVEFEEKAIVNFLLNNISYNSIYCRENSLKALSLIGNENYFVNGLKELSKTTYMIQPLLLTETINSFKGDKKKLTKLLFENFKTFRYEIKVSIINFVKNNADPDDIEYIFAFLKTESNEEVIFSCIRYFGAIKYEPSLEYLLKIGYDAFENEKWGFVAVVATALQRYRGMKSVEFLYKAVASPDWQSRENAAKTLIFFFGKRAFKIVEKYKDKYASEMVRYVIDDRNLIWETEKGEK